MQEAWSRLVPFGNAPTEKHFKTFFEESDSRDFSGPADSHTISQRFSKSFTFVDYPPLIHLTDTRSGIVGASKVHSAPSPNHCVCATHSPSLRSGLIGSLGHAVGSKFTLADILIFNAFGDVLPAEQNPDVPPHIREPFGSLNRTQQLLRKHPKVSFHAPRRYAAYFA
jgi:hypothetical protein